LVVGLVVELVEPTLSAAAVELVATSPAHSSSPPDSTKFLSAQMALVALLALAEQAVGLAISSTPISIQSSKPSPMVAVAVVRQARPEPLEDLVVVVAPITPH
jgi:hypothetical protein